MIYQIFNKEKCAAINELVNESSVFESVGNREVFKSAVFKREAVHNTFLAHGVAAAHGQIKGLTKPRISFGVSSEGIDYNMGESVNFLFVIASGLKCRTDYVKALASCLKFLRDDDFRQELLDINADKEHSDKYKEFEKLLDLINNN